MVPIPFLVLSLCFSYYWQTKNFSTLTHLPVYL